MEDKVKIFALGGLDEDGKNCTVVEINDEIYVVSCGVKYPDRSMPGIDYVIPNAEYLIQNKNRIKAYLLPHGHDDETGALAYIYQKAPAPVYGSKVTIEMFKTFARHVGVDTSNFVLRTVEPSSVFHIGARKISFFQTSHNIAESSGIAISTSQGNVVFTSDFVIENNASKSYMTDLGAIAKVAEDGTLVLLPESVYAYRPGYTAPQYKLTPLIEKTIKDAPSRVFISMFGLNFYNIDEVFNLAVSTKKRLVPFDKDTEHMIDAMVESKQLVLPRDNYAPYEDIIRYRAQDLIVLMLGFGTRLYNKIALLAAGQNEGSIPIILNSSDTFIMASPSNDNTEIEATDALDELYRSGCRVFPISKKSYLKMHASEEDLKMMISLFHPKYYVPLKGYYKDLLINAQAAVSMGGNLNYRSVFLLENGTIAYFDGKGVSLTPDAVTHGDIMIDGIGVGDVGADVLNDREKLSQGVVIMAATISKEDRRMIAGPDIQFRGLVLVNDSDALMKELTKLFSEALHDDLADKSMTLEDIRDDIYGRCLRTIRRQTGNEPMILPLLIEG